MQIHSFLDLLGDSMFNLGIDVTAKLHAEHAAEPTYFHHLIYPGLHSLTLFGSRHDIRTPPIPQLRSVMMIHDGTRG